MPNTDCFVQQTSVPSFDLLLSLCTPYLEQMCCSIQSDPCVHQMQADATASHEMLQMICEPFFEHMVNSLQHGLQQQAMSQSFTSTCFQYQAAPFFRLDEESTEANDSTAFTSLLSSHSSEEDAHEVIERKSEVSEPTSDAERSIMVCRHWKSKGWCRLGASCKFLHPENKCGVSFPGGRGKVGAGSLLGLPGTLDCGAPPMPSVRRKKRGGKNRTTRSQQDPLVSEAQREVELEFSEP